MTRPITITGVLPRDIRFPTSDSLLGSDAMNPAPDYSATYVELTTDHPHLEGHGLTFTIGRGNELCVAAVRALEPLVAGKTLESFTADMAAFWRMITGDSQLRWVGPDKGVIHLATAAVVNAVWDLYAKVEGKPLWKLLVDMSPSELVACIDFRYITDVMTPADALEILQRHEAGKSAREAELRADGYPAYTTSAGWLGYSDDKLRALCRQLLADGWQHIKIKVGRNAQDDTRRAALIRSEIGPERKLMMDANQVWDVDEAISRMAALAPFDPWWIEEPTSPDDVLGHARIARAIAPIRVATGEHVQNRVMFKQLLESRAIGFCQIDACRLGGVNEVLAVLLMAARFGIPVCPHAGGVGLNEYVQHLSCLDYIAISGSLEDRVLEYVDGLHEHFLNPPVMRNGRNLPPLASGYSVTMRADSLDQFEYPNGPVWAARRESSRPADRATPHSQAEDRSEMRTDNTSSGRGSRMLLEDRVAVITGAGSGIGRAMALAFAREGARVFAADLDERAAAETVALVESRGGTARHCQVSVDRADEIQQMVDRCLADFGRIDILCNNAGVGSTQTVVDTSEEDWDTVMDVNARGTFLGCKYTIPPMVASGGGVIVNTASVAGLVGLKNRAAYCAAKGAIVSLTRAVAIDHVEQNIRCNCICPGTVDSPWVQRLLNRAPDPAAERAELTARQPMGRLGLPEEVAQAAVYLASDHAAFVTGTALVIDGGLMAQ